MFPGKEEKRKRGNDTEDGGINSGQQKREVSNIMRRNKFAAGGYAGSPADKNVAPSRSIFDQFYLCKREDLQSVFTGNCWKVVQEYIE